MVIKATSSNIDLDTLSMKKAIINTWKLLKEIEKQTSEDKLRGAIIYG